MNYTKYMKKNNITPLEWLLIRRIDPLNDNPVCSKESISKLVIKQISYKCLSEIETTSGYRVLITDGYASSNHNPGSLHYIGKAIDFVLLNKYKNWKEVAISYDEEIVIENICKKYCFLFINEYIPINKTSATTAGHYHLSYLK